MLNVDIAAREIAVANVDRIIVFSSLMLELMGTLKIA